MDLFCYVDTESSGLTRRDLPWDDAAQPHLLQVSATVTTADREVVSQCSSIIKPNGWSIEPAAIEVHGITERKAHMVGLPCWFVLAELQQRVKLATKIIGFNLINHDRQIIANALTRENQAGAWWHRRANEMIDLMEEATPVMKLESQLHGEFKFPTLQEAVRFFGRGFDDFDGTPCLDGDAASRLPTWVQRHRADDDVKATEFIHWRLRS